MARDLRKMRQDFEKNATKYAGFGKNVILARNMRQFFL